MLRARKSTTLSTIGARADLEKLLGMEPDDPEAYANGDEDEDGIEEDMEYEFDFTDPEPEAPEEDEGKDRGHQREADRVDLPPPPVPKRVRRKGPGEHLHTAMMLKKCLTERSRDCIPPELHSEFKQAEQKQIQDHYDHSALTPLTLAESDKIRASIPANRILTSRFAYKEKNFAKRKVDETAPWRAKARLVVGGHRDPDAPYLTTDAPTISRLAALSILQVVASRQGGDDAWIASAGDVESAFLNGPPLQRLLYLQQPASGVVGMEKGALWKVEKGIFGLVEIKDVLAEVRVKWQDATYFLEQLPLDPCVFCLKDLEDPTQAPKGYLGIHVDDLLAARSLCNALKEALSAVFRWTSGSTTSSST